jgi:AAA domain-containing protein/bifunctional DNA primase/polymerase-like protein
MSLDTALSYIARGWNPVPIPYRKKGPREEGWQKRRIDAQSAPQFFNGTSQNIGVQLGQPSSGLTDVDLDCLEAIAIARFLLPPTGAVFGRPSKRGSHWLYVTDLFAGADTATVQFKDPRTKQMVLELRIGGGDKGAQTVFPPSVHESGETVTWEQAGEPASFDGGDLRKIVCLVAACCLMARYWPVQGSRHDSARVIGGFLVRAGNSNAQIRLAVEAVAKAAGDPDWRDRCKAAEDAANAYHGDKRTYGFPAMREVFGEDIADRIADWLGYRPINEASSQKPESQPAASATLESTRASTIKIAAIQWLWPDRFALGKLGLLVGLPDEGKGQILADMAARVTRGAEWPCDEGRAPRGNVILLSAEDDASDTVVPRLLAADADLDCIEIVKMIRDASKRRMFSLVTDLPLLRTKIAAVGDVRLIQIDPISAYLGVGKVDSFRTTDVRAVLAPLVDLAAELKVAIVGIMHFNKKVDVTNALLRISDSLAFAATARHCFAVVDDPENKRKLVVRGKNNLARYNTPALAYNFGVRDVGTDPETNEPIRAPHILWHAQHVDVTASEAMQAATGGKAPAARDDAKEFLKNRLADGSILSEVIEEAATAEGISRRTLFRAKRELGIAAVKSPDDGKWRWEMRQKSRHED